MVQNEAMRFVLGCSKNTPTAAVRYILDLTDFRIRQKWAQVKKYLNIVIKEHIHSTHIN